MTTSTLERVDLEHLLDAEPGCEDIDEATDQQCEQAAEFVIVPLCDCDSFLSCEDHARGTADWIARQLPIINLRCVTCGCVTLAYRIVDVLRIVPL
jgi:hypothetical protein